MAKKEPSGSKTKKHWQCEGFVRTGCGGRGARVVDLKRGKEELEGKHKKMQEDLDREIVSAEKRESDEGKVVAEAAQTAAAKAAKAAQDKINKKREQKVKGKREPGKAHPGSKKPSPKRENPVLVEMKKRKKAEAKAATK